MGTAGKSIKATKTQINLDKFNLSMDKYRELKSPSWDVMNQLTCQTQSRKRRKTAPCPLYLTGDTPTFTQRSANGWPPRNHSLSISPSNLDYMISKNLH